MRARESLTVGLADIKSLATPQVVSSLGPAFQRYNEEQFATVKLPGSSQEVIISSHNSLGDGRYYDVESSSSFQFDHTERVRPDNHDESLVIQMGNHDEYLVI
ncbi:hypothetical protein IMZ48_49305 [Candidatus Bathyarchaeota archaeon]|nr:hypothetical protein [Candidatus Bathyarchaeota archaeon]